MMGAMSDAYDLGPYDVTDSKGRPCSLTINKAMLTVQARRKSGVSFVAPAVPVDQVVAVSGRVSVGRNEFRLDNAADVDRFTATLEEVRSGSRSKSPGSSVLPLAFTQPLAGVERFQYAVINTGTFNSSDRLRSVLDVAGQCGWELVTVYDKSSNWFQGWEKGLMLMKRRVPDGEDLSEWCIEVHG